MKEEHEETTHLTAATDTPSTTQFVTVGEAIERVGCGFGTILYALGPYGSIILAGAELTIMSIVSLMVRCEWKLSTFSMSVLQIIGLVFLTIFSLSFSNLGDKYGRRPVLIATTLGVILLGALSGLCTEYWHLLICRAVIGACSGIGTDVCACWWWWW